MSERSAQRAALLSMLAGAALIGTNGLMVRWAGTPPTISAFYRMLFAGLMLALLVVVRRDWRPLPRAVWLWSLLPAGAFAADLWLWHRGPAHPVEMEGDEALLDRLLGVLGQPID